MMETRTRRGRRGVSIVGLKVARIRALVVAVCGTSEVGVRIVTVGVVEPLWVPVEILRGFQPSLVPRYPGPPTHTSHQHLDAQQTPSKDQFWSQEKIPNTN